MRKARWIRSARLADAWRALAQAQSRDAEPIVVWSRGGAECRFVLIAPAKLAPGLPARWLAWGLAPVIATYRHFGIRAYLQDGEIRLQGARIAESRAESAGPCVAVRSSFVLVFPERGERVPAEFRAWLSEGVGVPLDEQRQVESVFRSRLEAQHGWQFEHAWPNAAELTALARAGERIAA